MSKSVLLTGGMGYVGSHTAVALLEKGYHVIIFDNLSTSFINVKEKIENITSKEVKFIEGDIRNDKLLKITLTDFNIDTVIHFAGLKVISDSVKIPIEYFDNNVNGTLSLVKAMQYSSVNKIVFSSSATVYGIPEYLPCDEDHPTNAINPYGRSKLHVEEILKDICISNQDFSAVCLRYFNPVGAHNSALIGEDPYGIPNNLMPYIAKVASGKLEKLRVFGDDYNTPDGTGVRDYIHVMDLAEGHVKAIEFMDDHSGWHAINLGTGKGISVLEMVKSFERINSVRVPYHIVPRRNGDVHKSVANVERSKKLLNWQTKRDIDEMCQSTWQFQKRLK